MKPSFLLLFLIVLVCPVTLASEGKLTVATFIEPPFAFLVDNEFVGEHVEIVKTLSKSLNLTPIFIRCPFARCLTLVEQGKADLIFGLKKLPEREKNLIFLHPPYMVQHFPLRFFTLASKEIEINNIDDLKHLTVGVLRGGSYFELFDNNSMIEKVELNSREQLVNMLLRGRIDTFIEREESILPFLSIEEYYQKFSLANYQYDKAANSYIAISKHSNVKYLAKSLSEQLNKLVSNGTIETIRMKKQH